MSNLVFGEEDCIYTIIPTSRFKRDLKSIARRGYPLELLKEVICKLAKGEALPPRYKDHPLRGDYKECNECHITPDWLLVYAISEENLILTLTRTGTHSDLF